MATERTNGSRAFRILFLVFSAMSAGMILLRPVEQATAFCAIDDAMYYLKIAWNLVETGRCTYDGVTRTNGFHPLWLVVLLPVYAVFRDPQVALRAVFGLVFLVLCAGFPFLRRIADRLKMTESGRYAAGFLLLLNLRSFTLFYGLLESPLVLLLYLIYLDYAFRAEPDRWRRPGPAFRNGLLIGLCFLARLDSFLLAAAYALVLGVRVLRGRIPAGAGARAAASAAAGCLLLVVPYLAVNLRFFGRLETVSAYMKGQAPSLRSFLILRSWFLSQFLPRFQYILGLEAIPRAVMAGLLLAALAAGAALLLRAILRSGRRADLAPAADFWLFAGMHLGFIVLVAPLEAAASIWYLVPAILAVSLLAGWAVPEIRWRGVRPVPVLVLLLLAAQAAVYPGFVRRKTMTFAKLEAAREVRERWPADARGCMFDSGIVSYFGERDFVSLNGLIGDFEMADRLRAGDLAGVARRCGIRYLVLDTPRALLDDLAPHEWWRGSRETRFANFREAPKPFVIYAVTPETLAEIWEVRNRPPPAEPERKD